MLFVMLLMLVVVVFTWINGVVVIHEDAQYEHVLLNGVSECLMKMF